MSTESSVNWSAWNWVLQRVTAVGLVVLLSFHFAVEHFIVGAHHINAENTVGRITNGLIEGDHILGQISINMPAFLYQSSAVLLLGFSIFHGMYGVYNVAMEQDGLKKYENPIKYFMIVLSVALFIQGMLVFAAFFEPFWQIYDPR